MEVSQQPDQNTPLPIVPETLGRLPPHALLLALDADGLPVFLYLRDPRPGPILIAGDSGSGKTAFLQTLLRVSTHCNSPGSLQFAVLTSHPQEWEHFQNIEHIMGIWSTGNPQADLVLQNLAWPQQNHPPSILLFDGLDSILHMATETQESFRTLLMHGPAARIWPIVTVNAAQAIKLPQWLAYFRTRIYGQIGNAQMSQVLTPLPGAPLQTLAAGFQFCIREKSRWLLLRLPIMPAQTSNPWANSLLL
ncbi:MAG: hypothetical protein DDG60_06625 [Anaerolineae bacterium]|nr:MAG: hypothetical protein DDG60_06625 [Anaerolineae bacterium]